jgi:hypothetical protein
MTMHTRIRILDPVDVHELFRLGQRLLAERDEKHRLVADQVWHDRQYGDDGQWIIGNDLGQGLPRIWDIHYRPGGHLRAEDDGHDKWCEDDCQGSYHDKACYAEGGIDTAYSYQDAHGGVGNLHAWFIAQLGNWLDAQSARWSWYDESGGEWYDSAADLVELCRNGAAAQDWFRSMVVPAMEARAAAEGSAINWQ